jgi:enoyl-CoA hydratase
MYATGTAGDFAYGRRFWRDEYRMNARLFEFPKPTVSFLQGFTMGGGVGVGCHAGLRIVGETAQIAMPECGIGLIPDVGGTMMLAHAPGRLGEYLGTTGTRMGAADAILAGFADVYLPEADWDAAKAASSKPAARGGGQPPPPGKLAALRPQIDRHFAGETLGDIVRSLRAEDSDFARDTLAALSRNAPLVDGLHGRMLHRLGDAPDIRAALAAGIPLYLPRDGTGRFPGGHPRRHHRQGPHPALAPRRPRRGARGRCRAHADAAGPDAPDV